MMKKSCSVILLILLFSGNYFAQVAKDDFMRINSAYVEHPRLSIKIKYEVYKNKDSKLPFSTETGEVKCKDKVRYSRVGNIENIEKENYRLIVDHEDKNISLLGITGSNQASALLPIDLEKLLGLCSKVEFQPLQNNQNCYRMLLPGEEYGEIKLIYNAKTFFIEKLILQYAKKENLEGTDAGPKEAPRMEISYMNYSTDPEFGNTPFNYDAFLEKKNGKLVARNAYKTYTVNEQLFN
jgi:hypothetical protein